MARSNYSGASGGSQAFDTLVIGGGQAGLAAGYHLACTKQNFAILDESLQTGASWRDRWDSLRLFTPSQFDGLPGLPFPAPTNSFPMKNEVGDYLEDYARHFNLPVRRNVRVDRLAYRDGRYEAIAGPLSFSARSVVVATGPYHAPRVPAFASELDPSTRQLHSSEYRNAAQIAEDRILVVGAGNSGIEIAIELATHGKHVWLAGRDVGRLPSNNPAGRVLDGRPLWWLMNRVLTVDTPIGRRASKHFIHEGVPLGRAGRDQAVRAGVTLVPRAGDAADGKPRLEDGQLLNVQCVVWGTGYRPRYDWIDLPICSDDGRPLQQRGVVDSAPGLYFVGLPFQAAFNSALLGGVGRDAGYIVKQITARAAA
jgi:putative flavoprotein involved in K+ transport